MNVETGREEATGGQEEVGRGGGHRPGYTIEEGDVQIPGDLPAFYSWPRGNILSLPSGRERKYLRSPWSLGKRIRSHHQGGYCMRSGNRNCIEAQVVNRVN